MPGKAYPELLTLIKRLSGLLDQNIDLWLKPYDLARTQYLLLRKLKDTNLTATELAASMQLELATVSGVIDALVTKGLVTRIEREEDKRCKDVQITPAGRDLLQVIISPGPAMERVLREEVDPGDVYILKAVGRQMVRNLEAELKKQEVQNAALLARVLAQ